MDSEGLFRHRPLGVDVAVKVLAGGNVVDQLHATDLDDAIAGKRVEARGFRIEDDFAAHLIPSGRARMASTSALTRFSTSAGGAEVSKR